MSSLGLSQALTHYSSLYDAVYSTERHTLLYSLQHAVYSTERLPESKRASGRYGPDEVHIKSGSMTGPCQIRARSMVQV